MASTAAGDVARSTDELAQLPVLDASTPLTPSSEKPSSPSLDEAAEKQSTEKPHVDATDPEHLSARASSDEHVIRNGRDVSNILISDRDDGDACFTLRSITLGLVGAAFQATLTQIYRFKPTEVDIGGTFLAIIIFVLGTAWARILPTRSSLTTRFGEHAPPAWLLRAVHVVNPGTFGLKEHAIAAITASSASNGAHSSDVFGTQKLFYPEVAVTTTTAVLSVLSIGLFGYGLAGVFRPIIVYPAEMVYWGTLPLVDMFQAFHWEHGFSTKRVRAFWYSFAAMGTYEVLPAYIFPTLNSISIPCLASMRAPASIAPTLTNLFGGAQSNEGMGLLSVSLDWQYITSSQLALPLIQQANSWIGLAVCYVAMAAIYYTNVWGAKSFPFMSTSIFADSGKKYNQSAVFVDGILDRTRLEQVGYPNVTGTYAWGMLMRNAAIGALVAHVVLFWGKDVWRSIRQSRDKTQPDRHWQAMQKYNEAPHWWYLMLLAVSFVFGLVVVLTQHTTLPWYAYIISLLLGTIVAPFSGVLYAILGNGISTNQLTKMIGGIVSPGRPLANLYFYAWSHSTIAQVINLSNDLKMGQYLKIPPRAMFVSQIVGTVFGAFLNYAIASTIIRSKFALLHTNTGSYVWSGAYYQSLNVSAVTWSMAKYMYGPRTPYFIIPMAVLVGIAAVCVHYVFTLFVPRIGKVSTRSLVLPTVFLYSAWMTAGQNCTILSTIIVGVVSQAWLRRRYPAWFRKYNYIVGAGFDGGSLLIIFVLSFAVFGAAGTEKPFPTWAGNPAGFPDHCPDPSS
ncbi:related to peptide transporter Mtd1 [Sporisorium reilianum f. sp. reilianum]|uniref:Related to peptide transporter Mtd1 n=1 Tax=Sporisorium reilianum f. sp. reilianum TaxID=72559 RepID=A0A2N8UD70_9BASI|nr:related to peptide transporter Mtd1 [Sporisorium reilianum f. sp. reilianum]